MNIRLNKKVVALLLSGTMGFTLASCDKQKDNYDMYIMGKTYTDVLREVKNETVTDELLKDEKGYGYGTQDDNMYYETKKLEKALEDYDKIKDIGQLDDIPISTEIDVSYNKFKEYDVDYLLDLLGSGDENKRKDALTKLADYKHYYKEYISNYGLDISREVLYNSVLGACLDALDERGKNIDSVSIANVSGSDRDDLPATVIINDSEYLSFYDNEAITFYLNLDDYINGNSGNTDVDVHTRDYLVCKTALDYAKKIVARGGTKQGNKIFAKRK
ncbi:MAG: hypothetical protein IJI43_02695 [Bacilli bacterium]|nr:hypothetical protein [Bacilli bacterium]